MDHILISGGARGLGLAIVSDLLASGYSVSTFSRHSTPQMDELSRQYPNQFAFRTADLSQEESFADLVAKFRDRLGPVFALINNAATVQAGILATLPEVEISRMITVNLEATLMLTRACLKDMLLQSRGRIINISSILGTRGYNGLSVYSATKAGLDGFTRSLAREVGRRAITVNSVAPGYMKTEMSAGLSSQNLDQIVRRTPLGRLAGSEDITPLIRFLLSRDAGFITGQTILIDGGISN